jgi:hypothetical protein
MDRTLHRNAESVLASGMAAKKRTNIYLDEDMLAEVEEARRKEPGTVPTMAEMIRRLLRFALDAKKAAATKSKPKG